MNKVHFFIFFLLVNAVLLPKAHTQDEDNRLTEAQITIQDKFVEAKKYTLIGKFDKALEILSDLYKNDRSNATIALEISKVYHYLDDPYNEHRYARSAFENQPTNEFILSNYGGICYLQGKYDEALIAFGNLNTMFPQNYEYADKLAQTFLEMDNSQDALKAYDAIESVIGIQEEISQRKYEIYEVVGNQKNAAIELEKLSDAFPHEKRYLQNLASYHTKMGNQDAAVKVYQKILKLDINDANANMALASVNIGKNENSNYLRSLGPIIENTSISVDRKVMELIPFLEGLYTDFNEEDADALILLTDKMCANHPSDAKVYALKGDVLMATNRVKDAIKAYEKALSINDNVFSVWEGLLDAYYIVGDYTNMKTKATEALDLFPNKAIAHVYYGRVQIITGNVKEATAILEDAILVAGKDVTVKSDINAELGRAHLAMGDTKKSKQYIDEALAISQDKNPIAYEILGDIAYNQGDTKQALAYWQKAKDLGMSHSALLTKLEQKKI